MVELDSDQDEVTNIGGTPSVKLWRANVSSELEDLIPEFFEELRQELTTMEQALVENDYKTLHRLGHGFKGAARNYQLEELAEFLLEIERAATIQDRGVVADRLKEVIQYLDTVQIDFV